MHRPIRALFSALALITSPLLLAAVFLFLLVEDLVWFLIGRRQKPRNARPHAHAASVVIPNWNGRDLLEKYLPSVLAAVSANPQNELIVVDNGSSDGSAQFIRQNFPQVRLLSLDKNLGFGGGSNAGFRAARKTSWFC